MCIRDSDAVIDPEEARDHTPEAAADQALRVGWFRYFFDDDRWEWSAEVARMHGYEVAAMTPTTEVVLSHKHPEDREQIAAVLKRIRANREPFSSRHRIRDLGGHLRHVIVFGNELRDELDRVIGSNGFYVDLTADENARQEDVSVQVEEITERRSVIEQAKGMLMLIYSVDAAAAFELLRWRSQENNIKLRRLAEQVTVDFGAAQREGVMPTRAVYDNLLLTAHLRAGA
jgi:PAS domain S-box-containing protein